MDRRNFLGIGARTRPQPAPLVAAPDMRSWSRLARAGYLPNIPLTAHTGETFRFYDDLIRDRTVLFNFFLVGCTDGRCPIATANLREVQKLLGERMGKDVFFYSITLQPEMDTPQVLKEYAEVFDIQPGWLLLTGKRSDIELLRQRQGFVDRDPERDKDVSNHIGMARYGDDRLERWGSVSVSSKASNIASTFKWLSS